MDRGTKVACWLIFLCLAANPAFSHSAMFDDYFVFDDTSEGESAAEFLARSTGPDSNRCTNGRAAGYLCENIDLMAFLPKSELGGGSANLNDIWGWTDPDTGSEVAIVGRKNGTAFVDVTNAESPFLVGFLPSRKRGSDIWRDIKVYADHAFIVADGLGNRSHGLQIYDLSQLKNTEPGSKLRETASLGSFGKAHNIAINEDTGFAYIIGSNRCSGGLYMVDISDPSNPQYAGCFSADGYTHDAQCVVYGGPDESYQGREICMAYNEDTLTIVDVTDKQNPVQISRTGYEGSAYTHQGWLLDDNHTTLILNDELDEQQKKNPTTSYIWNISDLDKPKEIGRYVASNNAIDHNLYTKDGYVFETNYRSGLRILESNEIEDGKMTEVAYFDTIPGSDSAQFSGLWSSYIWFESGNIVVSDIGNGLFVVKPDWKSIKTKQDNL